MEWPDSQTPAVKKAAVCPNCGYAMTDVSLPTKCTECGFNVIEFDPPGSRRPTGWKRRVWLVGWPLPTLVVGIGVALILGNGELGIGIFGLCCIAVLFNTLAAILDVAFMPPVYDCSETSEQRRRRTLFTIWMTIGLAMAVLAVFLGVCVYIARKMRDLG